MSVAKGRRWLFGVGFLLALGGLCIAGVVFAGRKAPAEAGPALPAVDRPAVAVTVEPITARPIRRTVTVVGSLYGQNEVTITPKVEGRVLKIHHDVGDVILPGDTLLEIDPTDYQLAVAEARRAFELELSKLGLKELPRDKFDVGTLPSVVRAAAMERNAASRRDRLARLSGGGASSVEDRDQAQTDHEVARANHQQAILDAEATLAAARQRQATLDSALQRLRDTRVIVPLCGDEGMSAAHRRADPATPPVYQAVSRETSSAATPVTTACEYVISQRSVSPGEIVYAMPALPGATTPLFKLVMDQSLKLQATVPERYKGEVKVGQDVELEVEAYPNEKFAGKVARVNPAVDRASRTFQVEILVPNGERRLSAGSFAKAAVFTKADPAAATVPEEALVRFAGVTKLFVILDGSAHEVQVRPGVMIDVPGKERSRTWVEIGHDASQGEVNQITLPIGAMVVTSGQSKLAEGTSVRMQEK
jgi:multidrug efflux pump subunit AcrA (membrane-fusion protein)